MTAGMNRRRALTGAAVAGIGAPLLAACGDDGSETSSTGSDTGSDTGGGSSPEGGGGGAGGGAGDALTTTSDVPVGGGTIFTDDKVVVTQPTEGDFKAFSSICTHQGCPVEKVEGGQIVCPCHGSTFSVEDGSVTDGPAAAPLEEVGITVKGDQISLT